MFDPNNLQSVKDAIASGALSAVDVMKNPELSSRYTWADLELADPASKKFFGSYADEIALNDSPLVRATKSVESGEVTSAVWQGRAIKVTFFLFENAPRALVLLPDGYHQVTVKSIDFGTLREIVFWIDVVQYRLNRITK